VFNSVLAYIARVKQFHSRSAQYDQVRGCVERDWVQGNLMGMVPRLLSIGQRQQLGDPYSCLLLSQGTPYKLAHTPRHQLKLIQRCTLYKAQCHSF
jgi:hypothetical protein